MRRGIFAAVMVLVGTQLSAGADEIAAPPQRAAPSPQQIRRWIDELAADSFITREDATQELVRSGEAVIEPLSEALADADAETALRGIYILRELALAGDEQVEAAARDALVLVAHGPSRSAAAKATATVDRLNEIRQERVLAALEKLGAEIQTDAQIPINLQIEIVATHVVIGPEFRGTDKDLEQLRWLVNVEALTLEGERITNDSVRGVAGMKSLRSLAIKRAKITDEALASAADLPNLAEVDVFYSPVGDGALPHLKHFKTAAAVKLYGTKFTSKAAEELQLALVGTRVDVRRGAFLGIGCAGHPLGCSVTQVHTGSAADRADIRPGDVVTRYGERKVEGFEQLTQMIGENVAGDSVTLHLWRDGESLTKEVKLGEWD